MTGKTIPERMPAPAGEAGGRPGPGRRRLSSSERQRAALLRRSKRLASGLLVAVTAVFVVSTLLVHRAPWLAWVQATAVASMVGALADWFAVTALFRRPLGLPIPHTAIVVERKDRFGETLGAFVQESFLSPEAVTERLRASGALPRVAAWLAAPEHARDVAARLAEGLAGGADLLQDDDVHAVLVSLVGQRLEQVPLAPLAGKALRQLLAEGRHQPVLDSALGGLSRYLGQHGDTLQGRIGGRSPWWLPNAVEHRVVDRLLEAAIETLDAMSRDRDHALRLQLDAGLAQLADDLQHSDALLRRGEELKAALLVHPELRALAAAVWHDAKTQLRAQSTEPGPALRAQLAALIAQSGARLHDDPELASRAEGALETATRLVFGHLDAELARLVSSTIDRWDASDTSRRLELLLGPDLQYIRVNGTVVGALAGLALHGVSRLLA